MPINNISFKSSQINIVSVADNHGDVLNMPQMMKAISENKDELYEKGEEKSTFNLFAVSGDFFINPNKRGFLTKQNMSNGDIQAVFLNKMINVANSAAGLNSKFEAIYTPGNHCFDGGDEWLFNTINKLPMKTILTNLDKENSPLPIKMKKSNRNILSQLILDVPDDKNPELINKVLILGLTIPSLSYYNPGLLTGTRFYDDCNKNDVSLTEQDLETTVNLVKKRVKNFKKAHPKGAVVIMSHTGNKISSLLAKQIPNINLILNGHDHKDFEVQKGRTLILSHGQNGTFFRSIKLKFDDNGLLDELKAKKILTDKYDKLARLDRDIKKFLNTHLKKDLVPLVYFKDTLGNPEDLVLSDSIRNSNSVLANYVTSAIKRAARLKYQKINAVGIPSTVFRNGLKSNERRHTFNNIDLIKMFDGVSENLSNVSVGTITGEELFNLVLENVQNNLDSPTRNAIIQWSDIQVNKALVSALKTNKTRDLYATAIKIRKPGTKSFEAIDFNKEYTILLSKKYLIKDTDSIKMPKRIVHKFEDTTDTYDSLFRKYLELINYDVKITDKTREQRII